MDAQVRWENEAKSVVRCTFSDDWIWEDFYRLFEAIPCPGEQRLCMLIDLRSVTHIPSDAVLHLKRAAQMSAGITGMIIVIATETAIQTIYELFVTMYKPISPKFRLVSSDDEAYELLQMPS